MKILITGGAGFVGGRLARTLLERGRLGGCAIDRLVLMDQFAPAGGLLSDPRVEARTGPLLAQCADLRGEAFDGVFHLASAVSGSAKTRAQAVDLLGLFCFQLRAILPPVLPARAWGVWDWDAGLRPLRRKRHTPRVCRKGHLWPRSNESRPHTSASAQVDETPGPTPQEKLSGLRPETACIFRKMGWLGYPMAMDTPRNLPAILYKYMPPARSTIFDNWLIRFTQPRALNDPFEMRPYIAGFSTPDEIRDIATRRWEEDTRKRYEDLLREQTGRGVPPSFEVYRARFEPRRTSDIDAALARTPQINAKIAAWIEELMNESVGVLSLCEHADSLLM